MIAFLIEIRYTPQTGHSNNAVDLIHYRQIGLKSVVVEAEIWTKAKNGKVENE